MTTLAQAEAVAAATLEHGRAVGAAPLTVAVLDAGGHLVVLERADGSGILRPQIAHAKVGVSGDVSDVDEACALAGISAAGLRSDPVPDRP